MIKDIQDMKNLARSCFMSSNPKDEDYDEAYGFSWGTCRGCGQRGNCSNDDGYCTDCN